MKQGYDIFGKAYGVMLRNDVHAPGSVDDMLLQSMILLDADSCGPLYAEAGKCPDMKDHELYEFAQQFRGADDKETIRKVLDYTAGIALHYDVDFMDMHFGGTEKEILQRETDWCADMARVGAVLLQCLGIPCRILQLADLSRAYYGHVAGEAYYEGRFGVLDFIYGYQFYDGKPISAWEILQNGDILNGYPPEYTGYFSAVAVSEYDPTDKNNDYSVSGPNEYTRKIIYADHNGKWLMGEDEPREQS